MHDTTDDAAIDLDAITDHFDNFEVIFKSVSTAIAESQERCERYASTLTPGEVEIATLLRHQVRTQMFMLQQLVLLQGTVMAALEAFAHQEKDTPS